jgi:hypothetical protein
VYLVQKGNSAIDVCDTNLRILTSVRHDSLYNIGSVAAAPSGGGFFVSVLEPGNLYIRNVLKFSDQGALVSNIPVNEFDAVLFAVDSKNRLVFVSGRQDSIYRCDTGGRLLRGWGKFGSGLGYGDSIGISYIYIDRNDNIYAYEFEGAIRVFDSTGTPVRTIDLRNNRIRYIERVTNRVTTGSIGYIIQLHADEATGRLTVLTVDGLYLVDPDGTLIASYSLVNLVRITAPQGFAVCGTTIFLGKQTWSLYSDPTSGLNGSISRMHFNVP